MDESLIPSLFPGAYQDDSGRWFSVGPDGDPQRITEDSFYQAQNQAFNNNAASQGLIPVDLQSMQNGFSTYGLTPEQWGASYYGPGQFTTQDGQTYYKKNDGTTTADTPWSFNLAKDDLIGQMIPGLILGMAGGPLAAGLGGGILGGLGAGAIVGGTGSALMGGDPLKGALGGAISGGLGGYLPTAGITDPAIAGAIKSGVAALATGGDPLTAAVMGATSGYASSALNSLSNGLSTPPVQIADSGAVTSDAPPAYAGTVDSGYETDPVKLAANQAELDSFMKSLGEQTMQQTLNLPFSLPPVTPQEQQPSQPKKEEAAAGGKPVSFFDDILGNSTFQTPDGVINPAQIGDPSQIEQGGFDPNTVLNYINGQLGDAGAGFNLDPSVFQSPEGTINPAQIGQDSPWGVNAGGAASALVKFLLGSGATSDQIKRLLTGGGTPEEQGLLTKLFGSNGALGSAAAIAPSLAAINYAKNQSPYDTSGLQSLSSQIPSSYNFDTSGLQSLQSQVPTFNVDTSGLTSLQQQVPTSFNFDTSGLQNVMNQVPGSYNFDTSALQGVMNKVPTNQTFDTSKLTDAYNQFDPNSVTGQYDLNTAAARQGLASSLSQRGVTGSSFANSDFANFGQQRDVGRQSLINDAITRRAGIANDILSNDKAAAGLNMQGLGLQGQLANNLLGAQQSQAQLGLQGLGLKGQLANNLLDTQKSQAALGLQGLGLQGQFANQAINAQQQNNAQNLQGLGLKNQMAQSLLDNQYKTSALGLQGQGLQRNIFGDILNAQIASQKNKNDLYGRALLALSGGLSSKSAGIF